MQSGILQPLPKHGCYLSFDKLPEVTLKEALHCLQQSEIETQHVFGIGPALIPTIAETQIDLATFPAMSGSGVNVPSTQNDVWIWLRGDSPGELAIEAQFLASELSECFDLVHQTQAFLHDSGRDLTGYEDGTENPTGDDAMAAAIVAGQGQGLDGGSYVAVQQWVHDLARFSMHSQPEKDHMIGRRLSDNEELDDAPDSAHVKRTAQESFAPEAFMVRRSMAWAEGPDAGLMFVAFGHSHQAFEQQMVRMAGLEDGIVDALFNFTRPITGGYYWCPPLQGDGVDWSICLGDD
ncbi:Dyp-type peroxidase [Echinimonas agarilytica]|uniref:Dyp-type peroxidase n=1 Tax=Echinimonas agarilytica TaxID=1215918 RepID=A0AA41WA29_9GAMM|nr:Dyp-type peroxidase [Echinimonas agarilytica]MCM2681346.1 Dyp-type peroxidase [Echinimonas agarilytica]